MLSNSSIPGDVVGFTFDYQYGTWGIDRYRDALIRKSNGKIQPVRFGNIINCAGPWSADLARLMKIGLGEVVFIRPIDLHVK